MKANDNQQPKTSKEHVHKYADIKGEDKNLLQFVKKYHNSLKLFLHFNSEDLQDNCNDDSNKTLSFPNNLRGKRVKYKNLLTYFQ